MGFRADKDNEGRPLAILSQRGRRISAYPACAAEVALAGAKYAEIPVDQAISDGPFVTAPAWPAHAAWLAQFLNVLGTRITH